MHNVWKCETKAHTETMFTANVQCLLSTTRLK